MLSFHAARFLIGLLKDARAWNIALRTAHIATMGVLLGGHAFDAPESALRGWLVASVLTGIGLAVSEAGWHLLWFHQLRGLITLSKLLLLALVPVFWEHRMVLLFLIVIMASIGAHMSARLRYYSVVYREVVRGSCGPGGRPEDDLTGDGAA